MVCQWRGDSGPSGSTRSASTSYRIWASNLGIDFGFRPDGAANLLGIARSPHFTMWLIDEAHRVFSKWRQSRSFQMGVVAAFAACRKQQSAVELITSQEPEIGFDIKKELNFVIYPKPARSRYNTPIHWARTWAWEIGPKAL